MRPGGACTACPGFSLSIVTEPPTAAHSPRRDDGRHSRPGCNPGGIQRDSPGIIPAHSRDRPQSHATGQGVQEYRQARKQATEPPTGRKTGSRRKRHSQPHRATQRRRGYSYTTTAGKAPQSRPGRGCYSLYYPPPKRRTGAHRAAHRGQASGGARIPGTPPPLPRLTLPR